MAKAETADLVVVGAGMVGGWASWFAAGSGAGARRPGEGPVGQGASSRAAGVVRAQGGTAVTVALGRFSIDFYRSQHELLGTDRLPRARLPVLAVTQKDVREGNRARRDAASLRARRAMVDAEEACRLNPTLAADGHRGGSFARGRAIDPPRNVRAYSLAMRRAGVRLRERTRSSG